MLMNILITLIVLFSSTFKLTSSLESPTTMLNDYLDCYVKIYQDSVKFLDEKFPFRLTVTPTILIFSDIFHTIQIHQVLKYSRTQCTLNILINFEMFRKKIQENLFDYKTRNSISVYKSYKSYIYIFTYSVDESIQSLAKFLPEANEATVVIHVRSFHNTSILTSYFVSTFIFSKSFGRVLREIYVIPKLANREYIEEEVYKDSKGKTKYTFGHCNSTSDTSCINIRSLIFRQFKSFTSVERFKLRSYKEGLSAVKRKLSLLPLNIIFPKNQLINGYSDHKNYLIQQIQASCSELLVQPIGEQAFSDIIFTNSDFFNMVTCHGITQLINLQFYVEPYDFTFWVSLLILITVIMPFVLIFLEYSNLSCNFRTYWIFLFQFYAAWLEIAFVMYAQFFKKLTTKSKYLMYLWLIITIVLTNTYKSIITTKLCSPLQIIGEFSKAKELEGWTFVNYGNLDVPMYNTIISEFRSKFKTAEINFTKYATIIHHFLGCICFQENDWNLHQNACQKIENLREPINARKAVHCSESLGKMGSYSKSGSFGGIICPFSASSEQLKIFYKQIVNKNSLRELDEVNSGYNWINFSRNFCFKDSYYEISVSNWPLKSSLLFEGSYFKDNENVIEKFKEIRKLTKNCGSSGFIDYNSKLNAFLAYSQMHKETMGLYQKGNIKLLPFNDGCWFNPKWLGFRLMFKAILKLLDNGMYSKWIQAYKSKFSEEEILINEQIKITKLNLPKPLNLHSNISTIFYIFIFLSILLNIFLLGEIFSHQCIRRKLFSGKHCINHK